MKKQLFFVLILSTLFVSVKAQTSRPDVLVIGNGNAAFGAALQSAISGVKTTILLQAGGFDITPLNEEINSGIQADFIKKYRNSLPTSDSTKAIILDKQKANSVLSTWTDSIKNLTIIKNVMWVSADRSGNNWSFKLNNGSTIRPKVLINPGDTKLNAALKITGATAKNWTTLNYNSTIYRTSVAAGKNSMGATQTIFSMYQFFIPFQENLIWISDDESMLLGQAAGATAAYAAFFNTKTSLSNLRKIQGELIHYKLNLLPLTDVAVTDTTWRAIQQLAITGILKAEVEGKTVKFSPEKLVTTDEIKEPIKEYYYKAQIWFDDYKNPVMTIGSTLDMISYVGNKSLETIKKEIDKNWKTSYQFKTSFDLNRQINRREFAVLLQDYMPPFNVNINENGKVVR